MPLISLAGSPQRSAIGGYNRLRQRTAAIAKAGRSQILSEIEQLAASLEPALREAVEAYLLAQADAVSLRALAEAIKGGNPGAILQALGGADTAPAKADLQAAVQEAVVGAGAAVAAAVPKLNRVTFAFDRLAPPLVQWLQTYSLDLIREIDAATVKGIRTALTVGMQAGQNPIAVARTLRGGAVTPSATGFLQAGGANMTQAQAEAAAKAVKASIGLTDRQAQAVANYRKQLEGWHTRQGAAGFNLGGKISRRNGRQVFAVGEDGEPLDGIKERRLRDFRFDGKLKAALGSGKALAPDVVDAMVEAYARKYLRYRTETIARTEALRTTNQGVQQAWMQAVQAGHVAEGMLRRKWKVGADERLCAICRPIPRLNPKDGVMLNTPFNTPKGPLMLPPAHPDCRCSVWIAVPLALEAAALRAAGAV